jgi:hypothetical protein
MSRRKRPSWKPATSFKLTKLPPNGPKPGQSTDAFIYGKDKANERLMDDPRTKFNDVQ